MYYLCFCFRSENKLIFSFVVLLFCGGWVVFVQGEGKVLLMLLVNSYFKYFIEIYSGLKLKNLVGVCEDFEVCLSLLFFDVYL